MAAISRDVLLEQPQRVGVGDHHGGDLVIHHRRHCRGLHHAARPRFHRHHLIAAERRAGRVGSVSRLGDDDLAPRVAFGLMVGADHHDAGQLAVRAGRRMERHAVQPADLRQVPLQLPQQLQRPLGQRVRQVGVRLGKAGQPHHVLVHPGVVLHGARTERVEPQVDPEVPLRDPRVVADHIHLAHLGQTGDRPTQEVGRDQGLRRLLGHVTGRQRIPDSPGTALLEDQWLVEDQPLGADRSFRAAHRTPPSAWTSASISSRVFCSVTQSRRQSARSG